MNEPAAFRWPVRVYWEDTDAGGVVYYATYLKFLERARSEWLRALGVEQTELAARDGVVFVVRRVEVDYLRPARFNDLLRVECSLAGAGRASLDLIQGVWRDEEELVRASVRLACVTHAELRPAPIPTHLVNLLKN